MKTVRATAAVILRDGRCFVAKRGNKGYSAFKWEFPGGKIEDGETPEQSIVREIAEEIACEIVVGRLFMRIVHRYPTFILDMDVFLCELLNGEPQNIVHIDSRWVNSSQLSRLKLSDADGPIAKKLAELKILA